MIPQRYNFSSKSQQNCNFCSPCEVVVDTTKVQFFKQITTHKAQFYHITLLLLIPQRYNFSSKSQLQMWSNLIMLSCCWYHKGTIFQANHNKVLEVFVIGVVVVDTTKVQFFKQITTIIVFVINSYLLLLIPQRYNFSSKSQLTHTHISTCCSCCWYHKGTIFQANHNVLRGDNYKNVVVVDTTKVRFFKQITT